MKLGSGLDIDGVCVCVFLRLQGWRCRCLWSWCWPFSTRCSKCGGCGWEVAQSWLHRSPGTSFLHPSAEMSTPSWKTVPLNPHWPRWSPTPPPWTPGTGQGWWIVQGWNYGSPILAKNTWWEVQMLINLVNLDDLKKRKEKKDISSYIFHFRRKPTGSHSYINSSLCCHLVCHNGSNLKPTRNLGYWIRNVQSAAPHTNVLLIFASLSPSAGCYTVSRRSSTCSRWRWATCWCCASCLTTSGSSSGSSPDQSSGISSHSLSWVGSDRKLKWRKLL